MTDGSDDGPADDATGVGDRDDGSNGTGGSGTAADQDPTRVDDSDPEDTAVDGDATGDSESTAVDDDATVDPETVADLRERIAALETRLEERTVHREAVETDLRQYVRRRMRRGHARGWGPYLVLLYGVVMTLGAFYYLSGGWAILAMVVVWLSTLGLFVVMVLVGWVLGATATAARVVDRLRQFGE